MEKSYLITLREDELEQLIIRCVRQAINGVLLELQPKNRDKIGGMDLAREVTGLSKATIYGLTSRREIPHRKLGKRLYFEESELVDWINSFRRKTVTELDQEAEQYLQIRLQRHSPKNNRETTLRNR